MADSIRLLLDYFEISIHNSLGIKPPVGPSGWIVVHYDDGNVGYATRIRHNGRHFYLYSAYGNLYVNFSLARIASGSNNLKVVNQEEAWQTLLRLEHDLEQIGVITDISRALITRLDLFSDAATVRGYAGFMPLFDILRIPRRKRLTFPGYLAFKNGQRVDVFYDKVAQLRSKGVDTSDLPPNLIRFESRLMSAKAVRSIGVRTVAGWMRQWSRVQTWFRDRIGTVLRISEDTPEVITPQSDILDSPRQAKQALYARMVLESVGNVEELETILRKKGYDSRKARNFVETVIKGLLFPLSNEQTSINELKQELYTKLIERLEGGYMTAS
jgi:hypothetical protein